jgi:two-component system sensor histidine kinase UhpB
MLAGSAGPALLFITLGLTPVAPAVILGLLTALQTVALASVLRRVLRQPLSLRSFHNFSRYILVAGFGGTLAVSVLFLLGVVATGIRPGSLMVWRAFTLSAVSGYLMVTPSVLFLTEELLRFRATSRHRRITVSRWLEVAVLGLLLVLACSLVFRASSSRTTAWTAYAMTLPPLLLWAAMRFGALGASVALLFITVNSTLSTNRGLGPFTDQSPADNTLSLQLFILGSGVPLLALAILMEERRRAIEDLRSSHLRLRALNCELIQAREKEATRIAAELHDDVGQRLALVSIGLSRLKQTSTGDPAVVPEIAKLQEQTSSISRLLRGISHQLHPATLDQVGLASALRLLLEEIGGTTGLTVRMDESGESPTLSRETALTLYRVAQEALTNVIRHSGAGSVDLSIRQIGAELTLEISDDGRGFAPDAPESRKGLGLHSVEERMRLVGGRLTTDSRPGRGTTVRASVPFKEHAGA